MFTQIEVNLLQILYGSWRPAQGARALQKALPESLHLSVVHEIVGIGLGETLFDTLLEAEIFVMKMDRRVEEQRLHGLAFVLSDLFEVSFDFGREVKHREASLESGDAVSMSFREFPPRMGG